MTDFYLPSQADWKKWFDLYQALGLEKYENYLVEAPGLTLENAMIMICGNQYLLAKRPPTLEELLLQITDINNELFRDEPAYMNYPDSTKTKFLRDRTDEGDFPLLKSYTFKQWCTMYGSSGIDQLQGKTNLYTATEKLTLGHELLLTTPVLSLSLLLGRTITGPVILSNFFWSFLNTPNRVQWNTMYINKNSIQVTEHVSDILKKQSMVLGKFESIFWNMTSPVTLLLREYAFLQLIQKACKSYRENNKTKIFENTFHSMAEIAEMYLMLIVRRAKTLGLSEDDLIKFGPKNDPHSKTLQS